MNKDLIVKLQAVEDASPELSELMDETIEYIVDLESRLGTPLWWRRLNGERDGHVE
jgi:hypothetical protein